MGLKYYALFIDGDTYIEKCLVLLRYICKPSSISLPHITVRLFKDADERAMETEDRIIKNLNVIEPGQFNFDRKDRYNNQFVVFLRCESDELESVEYKPTYPQSRLHLTIYEGADYMFAKKVLDVLKLCRWHFAIEYPNGKKLKKRELGKKSKTKPNYEEYYKGVFDESFSTFEENILHGGEDYKLDKIREIIDKINEYIESNNLAEVASTYKPDAVVQYSGTDLDTQQESMDLSNGKYVFKKPCRDNIYITPPEYARDMAMAGIRMFAEMSAVFFNYRISFADSAIGNGSLYRALLDEVDLYNKYNTKQIDIYDAFGMDIDKDMAREASIRCEKKNLQVEWGDALNISPSRKGRYNLMMVNPPFNMHREIPSDYKMVICNTAKEATGIKVSEQSGLFVYYVLIMHEWLAENGIGVWLLPTVFMQTNYGRALKEYFLQKVNLLWVHIYDETHEQFYNTNVSTSVVVFQKKDRHIGDIRFTFGISIANPDKDIMVSRNDISIVTNWRNVFNLSNDNTYNQTIDYLQDKSVTGNTFGDYFDIKRGIATGANDYFVMTREKAKELGIPECVIRPILPKAKKIHERIIEGNVSDGYPILDQQYVLIDTNLSEEVIKKKYPDFYEYLQIAKEPRKNKMAVTEGALVKSRRPWYSQEKRDPPLYLLTYMGRNKTKKDESALHFILNRSNAVALNTYILLYPIGELKELLLNNPKGEEYVLDIIQNMADSISENSRVYSGGLRKIEPRELCRFPLGTIDLDVLKNMKSEVVI